MYKNNINRRLFIKKTGVLGTAVILGGSLLPKFLKGNILLDTPDISIVNGVNYFENTIKAVEVIGGMGKFVSAGSKVGLLINSDFEKQGAYVNPDISLAVIKMCIDAGAKNITCIQNVKQEYWERSSLVTNFQTELSSLINIEKNLPPAVFDEEYFTVVEEIQGAVSLKNPEVVKALFDCDVFINIPISKHHTLTHYTGALKNMMGVNTRKTNVGFHLDSGKRNDPEYLGQCICDVNLIRKADLVVVDSTEFFITNGPGGPGEIKKIDKIIAGTDIVALDALCCTYLDFVPEDVMHIVKSNEAGLGEIDFTKLNIREVS
ncbi:MAG: DUF362 domain-containing protein [Bacteroidales bacterium]|nr:DUF362 domain-containing protein [Bacteroidales bacterium]